MRHIQTIFQSIPIIRTKISYDPSPDADLTALLDGHGISYKSGRHSVYISNKADLSKISSELVDMWLPQYGLKIFKSRELSPDGTPYYTSKILAPASTYWSMLAVGNISEKAVISNLLHEADVAPRVYDLIALEDGCGFRYHAFIVQHVEGPVVHGQAGVDFLRKLQGVFDRFGVDVISIAEHCDMRPPYFRDNIIEGDRSTYYVDIQNFTIVDSHKVAEVRKKIVQRYSGDQLSEIMFGEITTPLSKSNKKAIIFQQGVVELLRKSGLTPQNCVSVDACKGLGTGMLCMLATRGRWAFLLRPEEECSDLQSFHHLRGYTRFDCVSNEFELMSKYNEYNFSSQEICVICDDISMNVQTIAGWDSCKYLLMIVCPEDSEMSDNCLAFSSVSFNLVEQVGVVGESEGLALLLYVKSRYLLNQEVE